MAKILSRLQILLTADAAELKKEVTEAGMLTAKQFDNMAEAADKYGRIVAASAMAAAAGLAAYMIHVANNAVEMDNLSQTIGMTAQQMAGLRLQSAQQGVDFNRSADAVKGLNEKMLDAVNGSADMAGTFAKLGVELTDSTGKLRSNKDVLGDVAEAFKGMSDGAEKSAMAAKLMGDAGGDLIPVLNQGRDAMRESEAAAEQLGIVVDKQTVAAIKNMQGQLGTAKLAMEGAANTALIGLAPSMSALAAGFAQSAKDGGTLHRIMQGLPAVFGFVYKGGVFVVNLLKNLGTGIGVLGASVALALSGDFGGAKNALVEGFNAIDQSINNASASAAAAYKQFSANIELAKKIKVDNPANTSSNTQSKTTAAIASMPKYSAPKPVNAGKNTPSAGAADRKSELDAELKELERFNAKQLELSAVTAAQQHALLNKQHDERIAAITATAAKEKWSAAEVAKVKAGIDAQFSAQHTALIQDSNTAFASMLGELQAANAQSKGVELLTYDQQREQLKIRHAQSLEDIRQFAEQKGLTNAQANELESEADKKLKADLKEVAAREATEMIEHRNRFTAHAIAGINALAAHSGKAAKVAQAIAKAQAIYQIGKDTVAAAMSAYAWGTKVGGPVGGALAASAAVAFGAMQMRGALADAPSAATPSAGHNQPSTGTSGAAELSAQDKANVPQQQPVTYLKMRDDAFATGRQIIDLINELGGDGKRVQAIAG